MRLEWLLFYNRVQTGLGFELMVMIKISTRVGLELRHGSVVNMIIILLIIIVLSLNLV